ncbi:methylated-DNA--[protein]-cysteine S-methyltransferase [Leuconostoc lactis]|uniref:methylated-DNA--[protein]-cysteine S-methyltransferase n=1 Tax=Leuconostoc lactis TaxID=1246 RepID=UPI00272A3747|nr:methylated-DNA--[protein]-cysteine S-methyltransferase [Leuconostoc lactis]WKY78781.1 methylated-DNA--[protein]-cysteine S-methyltransferase [Leuconostoc lactis]
MIIYETMPFLQRQLTVFKQDDAVVFVSLADDGRQEFLADYPTATIQAGRVPEIDFFRRYAAGESVDFRAIKIDYLRATPFQQAVWTALHEMAPTETLTYSDLAARANYPKAIRAVATAVGKNPLTIINACHRILPKQGGIGKYAYGPDIKQVLLALDIPENLR